MLVDNDMTCRKVTDNATRQTLDKLFYEKKNT